MCYFDHQLWPCGWWKWGSFRGQCPKEYRTGETCGLKLIYNTYLEPQVCKHCEQIYKKQRRVAKMAEDVKRWRCEGNRRATVEKTEREMMELNLQINQLWTEHEIRRHAINY
ncbi:hypothetical protein MYCTH_2306150 [Thermothelomyces thermophilus ATCC 42464]|uniref:Uncharacterized protein n=1 Tax=Thermothelomyces thermophilus (strain ATCC 42464 / BCRC 31852 / DSM 1799) TaxID=573729 RepID=G2QH05_THET4|nr:uncharacterized protein MYCTH_2306150 [Thermothelomyces thermophilus ATCC 42464]AEO58665.1 hypothetical protein MYCTH_2306150 [Thermothelomyces thermophilus ATCC 42464]